MTGIINSEKLRRKRTNGNIMTSVLPLLSTLIENVIFFDGLKLATNKAIRPKTKNLNKS